ncbi:amidase [Mesorhizobium sp. 128a]
MSRNSRAPSVALPRPSELTRLGVESLSVGFRSGQLSPLEVTRAVIDHAENTQAAINAFSLIDRESALQAARASEQRWRSGEPLSRIDGVPTTIKDIVTVRGWQVSYGSAVTDRSPALDDAPSVARLRNAGAVLIGQTTTPEFGWKAVTDSPKFGITRNPWNLEKTPGGSSGGAAAAAASGAGVLHLGTDGGGSIRIPASFSGIVGHKPSYGRVAAYPPSAFGTLAHIGPMARTVGDAAAMLEVMSGRDLRDWTQPPVGDFRAAVSPAEWQGKRIGYWKTPCIGTVDESVSAAIGTVLADLEAAGATISEIRLPYQDSILDAFYALWFTGAAKRLSTFEDVEVALLDPGFLQVASKGQGFSAVERISAELSRSRFGAAMDVLLTQYDLVLSPTVPIPAFAVGHSVPPERQGGGVVDWCSFSFPLNLSQQPACSIPCGLTADGLPIGMQIIGARGADADVLSAALAFEAMYPQHFLRPQSQWPPGY